MREDDMDPERRRTVARVVIEAPPERIWWAIAEPEGLRSWLCDEAAFETAGPSLRPGDRFRFRYWHITNEGTVVEAYPPRRLVLRNAYRSVYHDGTEFQYDLTTLYSLETVPDGTRLNVVVLGYRDDEYGQFIRDSMGITWKKVLVNLKCVLEFGHDMRAHIFDTPRLGILHMTVHPSRHEETGAREGNFVLKVWPETPAEIAGLRAGDVIVAMSGRRTPTFDDYFRTISSHRPGDRVTLDIVRHGQHLRLEADLPAATPLAFPAEESTSA